MQEYKRIDISREEVVPTAEKMKAQGKRLVMIHGYIDKEGKNVISYGYEVGHGVEAYYVVGESSIPSIASIYCEAASWPEREINELMGVEFEGLDTTQRMFMPEGMLDEKGQIVVTPLSELRQKTQEQKEE